MRRAIDISNYTPVPTQAQVACLVAQGYEKAVVGASYGSVAHAQLAAFLAGGMSIEAYAWVSFGAGWRTPIDKALRAIEGLPVTRLWLDCEEQPGAGYDAPRKVLDRIDEAWDYVADTHHRAEPLTLGIYTGGWWWKPNTGDSAFFATSGPLWTADYRTPDSVGPTLYGGWTQAAIWQHAGSVTLCGLNADDDVILEEDEMTPAQMQELKNYMDTKFIQLIGWVNAQGFVKKGG